MAYCPTASIDESIGSDRAERHWYTRWLAWLAESRSHRVVCLVGGVWLLNAFDLVLTVLAHQQGLLQEENPLARWMLTMGVPSIVLFKIGLVLIGSYPLLRFRAIRITELGTLVILFSYAILAVHWSECYELYAMTAADSIHIAELGSSLGTGS